MSLENAGRKEVGGSTPVLTSVVRAYVLAQDHHVSMHSGLCFYCALSTCASPVCATTGQTGLS
jgi:hypothetical protein